MFANSHNVIQLWVYTSNSQQNNVRLFLFGSTCVFNIDDIDVDYQNSQVEEMEQHSYHVMSLGVLVPFELDQLLD